ncbi:MAG TPA: permease [Methanospirillum sp.]|uniref:permease n=1 Tax=Methanospirillum sp. TaxID=45200 RepID=UPI002BC3D836|nr:permease [Methanospirillum sp.]HOJ95371.1 permease [Methanospirillum sp.]HOL41569.1 permease [Methanospirillum sp.]
MIDILTGAILLGWSTLVAYLSEHVITCLIPAFFIAGGIAAFVKKDAILKYFSPDARKSVSYGIASISGTVLAVCSCTILPMFAGILKKGSGIGPAITFLYAGPAINILAIVYSAKVLGLDIGIARATSAILLSIVIGLLMALIFKEHDDNVRAQAKKNPRIPSGEEERPKWVVLAFFIFLIGILLIATSKLDIFIRLLIVYFLSMAVAFLLIYYFSRDEVTEWGYEIWDLTKKIFPILVIGTFALGVLSFFIPPETFKPYIGDNSLLANFIAAIIGAILYMPTLLEVPVIGTTLGYLSGNMAKGPALSLLLTGPSISLPSILVLTRVMGPKKTGVYVVLVVIFSTIAGYVFGNSGL